MLNILKEKTFLNASTVAIVSESIGNPNFGELLTLEITGTATSFELKVEGVVNPSTTTWGELAYISSDNLVGTTISKNGIYEVVVQNLSKIRVNLSSITGGNVSVYGRMCG